MEKGVLSTSSGPPAPYLVMEWLEGETLEAEIARRQATRSSGRSLHEVITLLTPIAEALELAHHARVAHRCLTPSDVFLVDLPDGVKAKLLDLGLAKMMSALETVAPNVATGPGFAMRYGAPEQWNKSYGAPGPATDVYALALICVEMMTGKPALAGDEPGQLMGATIDPAERPTPQTRGADVPIGVELVFRQALSILTKNRYPNAGLFWDALCDAAGSKALGPKSSKRPGAVPSVAPKPGVSKPPESVVVSSTAQAAPAPRRASPRRGLLAVALLVPAAGIAIAFAVGWPASSGPGGAASAASSAESAAPVSAPEIAPASAPASPDPEPSAAADASGDCPEGMIFIPGGSFTMGSNDYADEKPVHEVKVASFCLDATEVTAAAYAECVKKRVCRPAEAKGPACNGARADRKDHPINCVDFGRADIYCRAQKKRLPTEEQWEYAARGGSERRTFPWGEKEPLKQLCWNQWDGTSALGTCPVGTHVESDARFGVHDLAGNVWEWTDTWHCLDYTKKSCPKKVHVVRGGSWSVGLAPFVRGAFRGGPAQASGGDDVGFRCAKAP
jgi:formylglycine-generating enzyme required for sulfatase activity